MLYLAILVCMALSSTPRIDPKTGEPLRRDPDSGKPMMDIVSEKGYKIERFNVTTDDGYILGMFHMPSTQAGSHNTPIILQHGILDSSYTWVNNFPDQSLGFMLVDRGFDVWLANSRGNTFSSNHVNLTTKDTKFWDFTWDDMALYDLPANIDFVLNKTKREKVLYVGHSQGTSQVFAALGEPSHPSRLKMGAFAALAPITFLYHQRSLLLTVLSKLSIDEIVYWFGWNNFFPSTNIINKLIPGACSLIEWACQDALFLVTGPSNHLNTSRMDVYLSESPAGCSVKDLVHFAQGVRKEVFQFFDYENKKDNEAHYHQDSPPPYNLTEVKNSGVPIGLWVGGEDYLGNTQDVSRLQSELGEAVDHYSYIETFAHMDFPWSYEANRYVYDDLIAWLVQYI